MSSKKNSKRMINIIKRLVIFAIIGIGIWKLSVIIQADTSVNSGVNPNPVVIEPPDFAKQNAPTFKLSKGLNFIAFDGQITPKNPKSSIFSALTIAHRYDPTLKGGKGGWVSLQNKNIVPKAGESFYLSSTVVKGGSTWTPKNVSSYTPTDESKPFITTLYPGWNMVANPYSHGYLIEGLKTVVGGCESATKPGELSCADVGIVKNYSDERKNGSLSSFYAWDSKNEKWSERNEIQVVHSPCAPTTSSCITPPPENILTPRTGYWIQNKTTSKLELSFSALVSEQTAPIIKSINPTSGFSGVEVKITGLGFDKDKTQVQFGTNTEPVKGTIIDGSSLTFKVPATTQAFHEGLYGCNSEGLCVDPGPISPIQTGPTEVRVVNMDTTKHSMLTKSEPVTFEVKALTGDLVSVKTDKTTYNYREPIKISITLTNDNSEEKKYGFNNGCQAGYTISNYPGSQACTKVMTELTLKSQEIKTWEYEIGPWLGCSWKDADMPVGTHTVTASVGSHGSATAEFQVMPTEIMNGTTQTPSC